MSDNADESKTLKKIAQNIQICQLLIYTTKHSIENWVIEQGFAIIYSQMRAMMAHAGLHENLKSWL